MPSRFAATQSCHIEVLLNGAVPVRLCRDGGRWAVFALSAGGPSRLGTLADRVVQPLRRRGQLVERPDGSLEPLRQLESSTGETNCQRPMRPAAEASSVLFNDAESPLTWLRSRKNRAGRPLISEEQYLAGERLRTDFERSMLSRRVTANWDMTATAGRTGGNAISELSDGAIAARQRFHAAMDAVGPELSSILYQVCCLAAGIEQAERLLELPQRSGKAVLGLALAALVRHYGFSSAGSRGAQRMGHWAMADYRPAIQELEDA